VLQLGREFARRREINVTKGSKRKKDKRKKSERGGGRSGSGQGGLVDKYDLTPQTGQCVVFGGACTGEGGTCEGEGCARSSAQPPPSPPPQS